MTNSKMTNLVAVNFVLENCDLPTEVREKIEKIRDSFSKKSTTKKPTANQQNNEKLKDEILFAMQWGQKYTVTDLIKQIEILNGVSQQKVSALVNALAKDNKLVKEEIKRRSYFSLPTMA